MTLAAILFATSLAAFNGEALKSLEGRIRKAVADAPRYHGVSGTVTYVGEDSFFMQSGREGLKVLVRGGKSPKVGDSITVDGRASVEGGRMVLAADRFSRVGDGTMPTAVPADAEALTDAESGMNWVRVEIVGYASSKTEFGFAVEVGNLPVNVHVEKMPDFTEDCEKLRPKVKVRGVAELILDQGALFDNNRFVIGVRLSSPSAEDVELMPDIGYFSRVHEQQLRLAAYVTIGLLAIALGVFWAMIIRHRKIRFSTAMVMADRKRMADDLHDTIEQHLAGAGMLVKIAMRPQNKLPPAVERPLKEAADVLVRAKSEMRDIVWGLKNDDMMRLKPAEMLRTLAEEQARSGLLRVRTRLAGLPEQLPGGAMRDLSLIVREAIGNAFRHGKATKIAITSDPIEGGGWTLRVANNGEPFDPESVPGAAEGHFGLAGMRQRARRIGAELSFSVKGRWTVLTLITK